MSQRDWWAERKVLGETAMRENDFPNSAATRSTLIRGLQDPERRRTAARWLAELGETRAIPALMRLLDARDPRARIAGANALGSLKATEAVERLTEMATSDEEVFVRRWAASALARIGDVSSLPVLIGLLAAPDWMTRVSAAYSLGVIGDPAALDPVRRAWRKDRWSWRYPLMRPAYRHTIRRLEERLTDASVPASA